MFRPEDIDAFNKDVATWRKNTLTLIKREIDAQNIIHRSYSPSEIAAAKALRASVIKNAGVANKIRFRMPRHMVFVSKGVGRGTKISQVGSTNRKAKPWFNPVIEKELSKLTDTVADHHGALILNAIMIK
jgi:hypothetical protein